MKATKGNNVFLIRVMEGSFITGKYLTKDKRITNYIIPENIFTFEELSLVSSEFKPPQYRTIIIHMDDVYLKNFSYIKHKVA